MLETWSQPVIDSWIMVYKAVLNTIPLLKIKDQIL